MGSKVAHAPASDLDLAAIGSGPYVLRLAHRNASSGPYTGAKFIQDIVLNQV